MRRHVLGICYPQKQDILFESTADFCGSFTREGYSAEVVNAGSPEGLDLLVRRLEEDDLAFCFGIQGVGSNLKAGEEILWTKYQVPFLGLHFDSPCHNPLNHVNVSPFVGNLYFYESFLDMRRRFFDISQLSGHLPFDTHRLPPYGAPKDFRARTIKLLYLKSGGDLQKCIDDINRFQPQVRDGVWKQLERTKKDPNLVLCELAQEIFQALGYDRRVYERQFWGVVQAMDIYIRLSRAIDFVNWLKFQEGAVIIGDGWDVVDRTGARAEFRAPVSAGLGYALLYETQFACNTNPYGSDLRHERIINGLLNSCCVLTDTNAWWDQHFGDVPALTRFNWDRSLDDQLQPIINDLDRAAAASSTGVARAAEYFTGDTCYKMIIDYAARLRDEATAKAA